MNGSISYSLCTLVTARRQSLGLGHFLESRVQPLPLDHTFCIRCYAMGRVCVVEGNGKTVREKLSVGILENPSEELNATLLRILFRNLIRVAHLKIVRKKLDLNA